MSNVYYENLRDATAGPLIEKYGMPLVLTRTVPGTVNENAGTVGVPTYTTHNCFGLVEEYDDRVVASSLVQAGEKKLLLSAKGLTIQPDVGDRFTMPDGIWTIPDGDGPGGIPPVQVLAPGGIAVIYTLRVRK
jgi:hypothetical protein